MHPSFQKLIQKKAVILPLAVIGMFIGFGVIIFLVVITTNNLGHKTAGTQTKAPLEIMREKQTKLRLTLDQEKKDRAKVHEAMDAPNHYQRLAD